MDDKVKMFIMNNGKYFDSMKLPYIQEKLAKASEEQFLMASSIDYKDPTMMLIISVIAGSLGIDRFMLGDTGMGLLKFFTVGLCGVLTIVDWFGIQKKTKEYNLNKLLLVI